MRPIPPFRSLSRRPADWLPTRLSRQNPLPGNENGSALIEFAVTLPVLFVLLFCFMEMCLAIYTHDMISESAREGTRYAMVRGASCTTSPGGASCTATATQIQTYVSGVGWPNLAGGTMTVLASYPDTTAAIGKRVQVKVSYVFTIKMPFVPKTSINMASTSVMYIIQ